MSPPGTVLLIEFTGLGPDDSLGALVERAQDARIDRIDPLDAHMSLPTSLAEQARDLAAALAEPPVAVLAHCTAARLAVHLAASIAGPQPTVLLLDPDPVSADYVWQEYAAMRATLGGADGGAAGPDVARHGIDQLAVMNAELAALSSELRQRFGADADADELVDELLGRYSGWLRFLAAGSSAGPVRLDSEVVVISSARTPPDLDQIVIAERLVRLPGCATAGTSLLASPAARRAVQDILRAAPDNHHLTGL